MNIKIGHSIEKLEVYLLSKEFTVSIYLLTENFPQEEKFGITSQLRRASSSIGANVSEGYGRYHYKEEILFDYKARGSLYECYFFLDLAKELKLISNKEFLKYKMTINRLGVKINNYIAFLKGKTKERQT